MNLQTFITAFNRAANDCRQFARRFVLEELPESLRFDFGAARGKPDAGGKIKYRGGRLLTPEDLRGVDAVTARKYLWVDGRIPVWVNMHVLFADAEHTYIEIHAGSVHTDDDSALYYADAGNPPFHILGPALPRDWQSLGASGRFSLHWDAGRGSV